MTVSSDEDEDDNAILALAQDHSEDDKLPSKPSKNATGKLKSVERTGQMPQPTPTAAAHNKSPTKSPKQAKTTRSKTSAKGNASGSPRKSKASKAKTTLTEDEMKPAAKPIYSFFNTATQKQQSSQPAAVSQPSRSSTPREQAETIESDDERGSLSFSKGSSTALAMRKRKVQHQDLENESLPPPATQKFRKTSDDGRTPSFSVVNQDKRPWIEQFAPVDLSELAVHKRKVGDVRQWLDLAFSGRRQKILVLKGSAGTGKTTTINLLAKDMGITPKEWKNPAGSDYASEGSASAAMQFEDFVAWAGKVGGLAFGPDADGEEPDEYGPALAIPDDLPTNEKQMLLIEEFPNTFSKSSPVLLSFRSALMQYLASPAVKDDTPTPIVLIVSETRMSTTTAAADSFTVHRLLGPELAAHPYLDIIEFNAIAPTLLTKALETIVVKEARKSGRRRTPGPAVIKHLAETGDIRSAVSSLEFLCLRGDDGDTWSAKVAFTKPKKAKAEPALTEAEKEALKLITNRESTLGIFHSVGKIIYNKRVEAAPGVDLPQPPAWLPQHRRTRIPENDVDRLIDELGTDTSTFNAALHENYVLSCSGHSSEETLDSIGGCLDNIADADLLSLDRFSTGTRAFSGSAADTLRQDEMSFQVAARGVLFSLPHPVHRGTPPSGRKADAHKMFYPASLKLWRHREEVEDMLELLTSKAQSGAVDGSARVQRQMTEDAGVASWKRQPADDAIAVSSSKSSSAKMEMLMERLPYMSSILSSSTKTTNTMSTLYDQIQLVTRISGSAAVDGNEDDDADKEADPQAAEQWTTDRPDADDVSALRARGVKRQKGKVNARQGGGEMEGEGLGIPVERSVERLALQDDDIVDD